MELIILGFGVIALISLAWVLFAPKNPRNTDDALGLYWYESSKQFETDYKKYKYKTPFTEKNSTKIDGEHVDRKYSRSNQRQRSNNKSSVDVTRKTDEASPVNLHLDIESYNQSRKSCEPSVSYRQSCASPVESNSSSRYSSDNSSSSSCDSGSSSCGGVD
jgi:hypothetical protein